VKKLDAGTCIPVFAFDQCDAALLNGVESFSEQRNRCPGIFRVKPTAGIETLNFGGGFGGGLDALLVPSIGGVGCAIQVAIVNYNEFAVFGVMIIEFNEIGSGSHRAFE